MNTFKKYVEEISRLFFGLFALSLMISCNKIEYTQIDSPAYLRVFNNLNYKPSMDIKDSKSPFFCMLINPVLDNNGKPTGAEIVGDFLDVRQAYAPPYPSHVGSSSSVNNPEYPGKENVLVGPIINGFDLSSWAQVPSGKMRVMFLYRPKNSIGYFKLDADLQGDVLLDTTINLEASEIYTLHLIQKDFIKRTNTVLLRQENFHKLSLSDSLVYVNFYNYSSDGFAAAPNNLKEASAPFRYGINDQMNVFLSLYDEESTDIRTKGYQNSGIEGYVGKYLTTMNRNNRSSATTAYQSFPVWANRKDNGINTKSWQRFDFFAPGLSPQNNPYTFDRNQNWESVGCLLNGSIVPSYISTALPNMLVKIHSGHDNPRAFATVNTIEVVNGYVYMTTIQRKYQPPIY